MPPLKLVPPAPVGPSDAELVLAARAGEEWASEALFRRHHRMIAGLAFRLLGRDADVEDVVQDAFVEALDSLDQLESPQAFSAWMCSIVVTLVARRLRRRRLFERLRLAPKNPLDFNTLLQRSCPPEVASELRAVYRAIEELSPSARMVLLLRRVEGLTIEEAARATKLSIATVKRRLAEAEEHLERFRQVT